MPSHAYILGIAGLMFGAALPAAAAEAGPAAEGKTPVRVVLDTDIGPDVDDVGAVAILHALADLGEAEIVAMAACTSNPWGAPCLDALNTYYGRPEIPVGTFKQPGFLEESSYSEGIARAFPNALGHGDNAPDATALYRRVLAESPDKLMFIAVGPLNNLRLLLESEADAVSPLNGVDLVRENVSELVIMGPYFNEEREFQYAWNYAQDPAAAAYVSEHWPTPMRFGEGNLGHRHFIGAGLADVPESSPVRHGYELAEGPAGKRHCADPSTILYAIRGARHFDEVRAGSCEVRAEDGATRWVAEPDLDHAYNKERLPVAELERIMEELLVKPPRLGADQREP